MHILREYEINLKETRTLHGFGSRMENPWYLTTVWLKPRFESSSGLIKDSLWSIQF